MTVSSHVHHLTPKSLTHLRLTAGPNMSLLRSTAPFSAPILHLHFCTWTQDIVVHSLLYLGGAGIIDLATYFCLSDTAAFFSTTSLAPATKPRPEKSVHDPERLLDIL